MNLNIFLSIQLAIATLVFTLIIGCPAAYVLVRYPSRLGCFFEELVPLPIAIPGLVIALVLITTYGGFGDFRQALDVYSPRSRSLYAAVHDARGYGSPGLNRY